MIFLKTSEQSKAHGWLILDKPLYMSSAQAVAKVKRLSGGAKIGHTGTLDPLASGVLPLAIGEATKLSRFLLDGEKSYEFSVQWGIATDTDDKEGQVIQTGGRWPSEAEIQNILAQFTGNIIQVPPVYSALSIGGKRAYARARSGEKVLIPPRNVMVYHLEMQLHNLQTGITRFKVSCGKGTYIRALARDMGIALSSCGHITELRRTKVGKFTADDAILLENLEEMVYKQPFSRLLLPLERVLDDIPVLSCSYQEKASLRVGQSIKMSHDLPTDQVVPLISDGRLFALGQIKGESIKPARILNVD